jgi:hypothetical protein
VDVAAAKRVTSGSSFQSIATGRCQARDFRELVCAVDVAAAKQLSHTATATTNYYYYYYYYQINTIVWGERTPHQSSGDNQSCFS